MSSPFDQPFPSREEQRALFARARAGDDAAHKALVESHVPLLARIAGGYLGHCGLEYADLFQAGAVGLVRAVDGFDPEPGHPLAPYAERCIRNAIRDALRQGRKVQQADWENWLRIKRAAERIWTGEDREATCAEVAAEVELSEEETERVSALFGVGYAIQAAEATPDVEALPAPAEQQPDRLVAEADEWAWRLAAVTACLPKLPETERRAVVLHHGWNGEAEHTLAQTAEIMNLTESRATELKNRGLLRLRRLLNVTLSHQ